MSGEYTIIRQRLSESDAHYGGGLVSGARMMSLFGDAMTWLAIDRCDDEGLLESWQSVEFSKPLFPGDFIRIQAEPVNQSLLKSTFTLTAYRDATAQKGGTSDCCALAEPEVVARATGSFVIPFKKGRETL